MRGRTGRRSTALLMTAVALCITSTAGCRIGDLQFKNDHRLSFEAPKARQRVQAPVTITWSMKDFDVVGLDGSTGSGRGVFALFVDRAPMPMGNDLHWIAKDDDGCKRDPRCPDLRYLADRGVHVTTTTSVTLNLLPRADDGVGDEQHYAVVVLLDGTGRRIGESAWYLPFTSKRRRT